MQTQHEEVPHPHFMIPLKYTVGTLISLLVLAVTNVIISQFDLGIYNIVIMFGIILVMATLDMLFFMGFRWERGFHIMMFLSGFVFLFIFLSFTLSDIMYRNATDPYKMQPYGIKNLVKPLPAGGEHSERTEHSE